MALESRVTQVYREDLLEPDQSIRVTRVNAEVAGQDLDLRVTRVNAEVAGQDLDLRVTRVNAEVAGQDLDLRVTRVYAEVLRAFVPPTSAPPVIMVNNV